MSNLDDHRAAADSARTRRAHLSLRAVLAFLIDTVELVERAARRARRGLDPRGGAHERDPRLPT